MQQVENTDSPGFDICRINATSLKEMYEICRFIPYAKGFNSYGFVKYYITPNLKQVQGTHLFLLDKPSDPLVNKNQVTNLPEIHVINMERRLDRKTKMLSTGFQFNFFKSIDGSKLTMTPEIKKMFQGNDFNYRRGVIGAALSHYTLWNQLINSDKDQMLIVEDDVEFAKDFMVKYSYAYNQLQFIKDWDILYLGWSLYEPQKRGIEYDLWNDNFPEVVPFDNRRFFGAGFFGYLLSKKGAQKLVNYCNENGIKRAIDCIPLEIPTLNRYFMFPHIIKTPVYGIGSLDTDTDIQKDRTTLLT